LHLRDTKKNILIVALQCIQELSHSVVHLKRQHKTYVLSPCIQDLIYSIVHLGDNNNMWAVAFALPELSHSAVHSNAYYHKLIQLCTDEKTQLCTDEKTQLCGCMAF
jgi:hypothetical protein